MTLMLLVFGIVKIYLQRSSPSVSLNTVSCEVFAPRGSTSNFKCHLVDCLDELLQSLVVGFFFYCSRFIPVVFDMVLE